MRRQAGLLIAILFLSGICIGQTAPIFEIHSGFWINLHQFLLHEATATEASQSDSQDWRDAVEYYRREMAKRDVLSPDEAALNNRLSAAGSEAELPADFSNSALQTVLSKAAPVYRRVWWPEHNRSNQTWIDAAQPLIAKYGAAMCKG